MPGEHRKHTPITSKAQRGMFGAELARRREGKEPRMSGITTKELIGHLHESAGKKLPARVRKMAGGGTVCTTTQAILGTARGKGKHGGRAGKRGGK